MDRPAKPGEFLNLYAKPHPSAAAPLTQDITVPDMQPATRGIDVTPIQDSDGTPVRRCGDFHHLHPDENPHLHHLSISGVELGDRSKASLN